MRALAVLGVGVCAAGFPDWLRTRRVLAGAADFEPGLTADRSLNGLPPTERRRINETSRLACLAAADALAMLPAGAAIEMPAIFTSSDGDGVVLAQMLSALARSDIVVSPTAFHNSVYNAPAGYWTIAARSTAPSTTVCADRESFAVALLEAYAQATMRKGPVLVVAVDAPFPQAIRQLGTSAAPFACAMVLDGSPGEKAGARLGRWSTSHRAASAKGDDPITAAYAGNAAAAALPLLRALARRDTVRVELPYLDGAVLELEVAP
jgi:beta-ketoacyl synthase-like protein